MAKKATTEPKTEQEGERYEVLARFESQYAARAFEPGKYDAAELDALSVHVLRIMAVTDAPHHKGIVVRL